MDASTSVITPVVAADGVRLALHEWPAPEPTAAVFYVHGLQSHAGWLTDTARALGQRGVSLFALDRRGSGRSEGPRGHLPSAAAVLADYDDAVGRVRDRSEGLPFTLLGQSFGGSVLAALLVTRPVPADVVVFCAPALGQQRRRHGPGVARLRALTGRGGSPVHLADSDYTTEAHYLRMLTRDPLMLRHITDAARATMVALEDSYMDDSAAVGVPVRLATPDHDAIVDLATARVVLARIAPQARERVFAVDRHYIEFTAARWQYWDWLAEVAHGQ